MEVENHERSSIIWFVLLFYCYSVFPLDMPIGIFQLNRNFISFPIFLLKLIAQKIDNGSRFLSTSCNTVFLCWAGNLMSSGGIAKTACKFFLIRLLDIVTGGLGIVTVVVCMFFAAISGSAVATVSAVGAFYDTGNGRSWI